MCIIGSAAVIELVGTGSDSVLFACTMRSQRKIRVPPSGGDRVLKARGFCKEHANSMPTAYRQKFDENITAQIKWGLHTV